MSAEGQAQTCPEPPQKPTAYLDVDASSFGYSQIINVGTLGVMGGCSAQSFCPDDTVMREDMAIYLERMAMIGEWSPAIPASQRFTDVPLSYCLVCWIDALARHAITAGCGSNQYCPGAHVTRAQMAVFLLKARWNDWKVGFPGVVEVYQPGMADVTFNDVPPGYWAEAWIKRLARCGVTSGCGGGNFCPEEPVTRAQMAVFLTNAIELDDDDECKTGD